MTPTPIGRREAVRTLAAAAGGSLAMPAVLTRRHGLFAWSQDAYSQRAIDLVTGSLVIDMLSPLTIDNEVQQRWGPDLAGFDANDAEAFAASGIDVFHAAVGVGGAGPDQAFANALLYVGRLNVAIAGRPDVLVRIDSAEDLRAVHGSGRIGILIGIQNSDHFRRTSDVALFHGLGQRVSQLTYNARNRIGNGSTERVDGGISDFGVGVVEAMNETGMAVDVSHSGDRTTLDACELSSRPVLFTHSNVRELSGGHPRTKTDEAIRAMARTGGVMGITGVRMFVKADEPTTIEHFLDHYDHVRDLVGVEHLGIGSDIDLHGYDDLPEAQNRQLRAGYDASYAFRDRIDIEGIDHPKRVFDLAEGLIGRGYTDDHIRGILGGNFARVLEEIWAV